LQTEKKVEIIGMRTRRAKHSSFFKNTLEKLTSASTLHSQASSYDFHIFNLIFFLISYWRHLFQTKLRSPLPSGVKMDEHVVVNNGSNGGFPPLKLLRLEHIETCITNLVSFILKLLYFQRILSLCLVW